MRPAMMLFLRALVILGAVLAVLSCGFATSLAPTAGNGEGLGATDAESCTRIAMSRMAISKSWATVPAAGGTIAASSGAGLCL